MPVTQPLKRSAKKSKLLLLIALSFWLLTSLTHLQFSLFLVNPIETAWGSITLKNYTTQAGYFLLSLLAVYLIWYFSKGSYRIRGVILWLVWLALIAVINQYLLATPIENIHFIQYGLLSALLLWSFDESKTAQSWPIAKALFWATLAGITDELLQYLWITASYSDYMDFNDFLLNLMGAIGGILFYTGFSPLKTGEISIKRTLYSPEAIIVYIISLIAILLQQSGQLRLSAPHSIASGGLQTINGQSILFLEREPHLLGSWQPAAFNSGEFYVLSPLAGTLLLFVTFTGFILLYKKMVNSKTEH